MTLNCWPQAPKRQCSSPPSLRKRPCMYGRTHGHRCTRPLEVTRAVKQQETAQLEATYSSTDAPSDDDRPSFSGRPSTGPLFPERHVELRPEVLLYAPIGVVVAALRSALWLAGIALDQAWFRNQAVVDTYLRLLGVTVTWKGAEHIPAGRHILVSNHVSVGDLMMLFSHPTLPRRYTHLITSSLPAAVTRCRHLPVTLRHASPAVYDELAASADPSPVHLFPEGGMTNGAALLRFSRGFTRIMQAPQQAPQQQLQEERQQGTQQQDQQSRQEPDAQGQSTGAQNQLQHSPSQTAAEAREASNAGGGSGAFGQQGVLPVVPVALRVRGMAGVNSHTMTSSFLANLFWFSFSPLTRMEATVLPPLTPLPGEARGAFVNRVQAAIAEELGVGVADMTIQQKKQLAQAAAAAAARKRR